MQLEHSFSVPVGIDEAWPILIDIERIGPCLPGAAIDSVDGDEFTGTVKVKLGPINLTYKGKAAFVEKDAEARRAVIDARGRDARGNGTASAKITATLHQEGTGTLVKVLTDLDITGKPAQFGRGVMVDVGNKLLGQFADTLAKTLKGPDATATVAAGDAPPAAAAEVAADDTGATGGAPKKAAAKAAPAKPAAVKAAPAKAAAAKSAPAKEAAKDGPATDAPAKRSRPKPPAKAAATADPASEPGSTDEPTAPEPDGALDGENAGSGAAAAATATAAAVGRAAVPDPEPAADSASTPEPAPEGDAEAAAAPTPVRRSADDIEPIDLLQQAGPAVAKRLAPVAVAAVVVLIAVRRRRRNS